MHAVLTPLAYMVLDLVPISVTLGVLFYLSYASLNGVQLVKRVLLLFTPPKHHPNVHYVRKVRNLGIYTCSYNNYYSALGSLTVN